MLVVPLPDVVLGSGIVKPVDVIVIASVLAWPATKPMTSSLPAEGVTGDELAALDVMD